jgi:hypothetical protein
MSPDDLRARQRELLDALTRPLTGASRARAGLPPGDDEPATCVARAAAWLAPSATLDPAARLEIYRRQYWLRLLGALADDYPALRWLLGPAAFAALAERYLLAHPPARADALVELGAALPAFLAATLPAAIHAHELAQLEAAWLRAFTAGDGAPVPAAALGHAPLALAPHVSLLAGRTAPDRLWLRARAGGPRTRRAIVGATPRVYLAVFRADLARDVVRLHPAAYAILASLAVDGSLPAALARAAPRMPARGGAARVRSWFGAWTARGWLVYRQASAVPSISRSDASAGAIVAAIASQSDHGSSQKPLAR